MPSFFSKIFGDPNEKFLRKLEPTVAKINQLESKFESFSNEALKAKTEEFRKRLGILPVETRLIASLPNHNDSLKAVPQVGTCRGTFFQKELDAILPEAFALVREAAKRTIGQRHFDEQLLAGIVLHQGRIAEQKTGEGKTLSATLAVYLNALIGRGVHVVTVNDYLARRDTNWMGPIYHLLGLSVGCLNHDKAYIFEPRAQPDKNEVTVEMENLKPVSRQEAYQADITYGTNNEFGFDYLRDNLVYDLKDKVQRSFYYAIVDEVDSILIDEARTPLIISAPDMESTKLYQRFAQIVPRLKAGKDYEVDEKMRAVSILDAGIDKVEKALGLKNIYTEAGIRYVHQLEQALRAQVLFQRDRDYLVKDGQVIIIDEFTGRLMPGRRFSEGLHQALEAKERVRVQEESRTLASITFQNYFRLYKKLAGMTGTAVTSAEEFDKVYHLDVVVVPTHRPMTRRDLADRIYSTEKAKWQAVVDEIKKRQTRGQPVLVGTRSVEKNEYLSALLQREGIRYEVLNAKNHEREAQIIAQAGRPGGVTVATNMAGRGVDIVLGGKEDFRHPEGPQENSTAPVISPESLGFTNVQPQEDEGGNVPRHVPTRETWQKLHDQVIKAGGLFVLGTERHEARRIDNQLRGRAGRQGDPGQTQFFVSLEDELMRIFGGDRLKNLMTMLKVPENMPIENRMISRAIESAQSRVEGYHFDSRKHTLEYDDVLNRQRRYIYKKRDEILRPVSLPGETLSLTKGSDEAISSNNEVRDKTIKDQILEMINNEITAVVKFHTQETFDLDGIIEAVNNFLPLSSRRPEGPRDDTVVRTGGPEPFASPLTDSGSVQDDVEKVLRRLAAAGNDSEAKTEKISDYLFNLAQKIYEQREKEFGQDKMQAITKFVLLRSYDIFWMEHLDNIEHLRQSVSLRAYGHLDPLVEYKNEGARLFQKMLAAIQLEVANLIFKIQVQPQGISTVILNEVPSLNEGRSQESRDDRSFRRGRPRPVPTTSKKIGRNEPCPCGSGKKYKKCCGR